MVLELRRPCMPVHAHQISIYIICITCAHDRDVRRQRPRRTRTYIRSSSSACARGTYGVDVICIALQLILPCACRRRRPATTYCSAHATWPWYRYRYILYRRTYTVYIARSASLSRVRPSLLYCSCRPSRRRQLQRQCTG